MKQYKKRVLLDEHMEAVYARSLMNQRGTNSADIHIMKKMLAKAMDAALTDRQKTCLCKYYYENKTQKEIGQDMGLNPSTVNRHINAAIRTLRKLQAFVDY